MTTTSSEDIISALATAASLRSSPAAQTERTSVSLFIQTSNGLAVSGYFSGLSVSKEDRNVLLLLNVTKKTLAESIKELNDARDKEKVSVNKIRLEVKNRSL